MPIKRSWAIVGPQTDRLSPRLIGIVVASALTVLAPARGSIIAGSSKAQDGTPLERAKRRYPPTATNGAALDVERLAKPLGIDLVPRNDMDRSRPLASDVAAFKKIHETLWMWTKAELGRASEHASSPPGEVSSYLSSRSEAVSAVRRGLMRGEPPVWEERLDMRLWGPRPNLPGIIHLHTLLIADALEQQRSRRATIALQDLEAGWKLIEPLSEAPYLQVRRMYVWMIRLHVGALRRVDAVPNVWRDRLAALRPVEMSLDVVRLDASLWPDQYALWYEQYAHTGSTLSTLRKLRLRFTTAYTRMCMEDASRKYLARLDQIDPSLPVCGAGFEQASIKPVSDHLALWNRCGGLLFNDGAEILSLASRLAFDVELTLKILELKALRDSNDGRWPATVPGIAESHVCPEDHWTYAVAPDGTMSLALSRKIDSGTIDSRSLLGAVLPSRYDARPEE